MAQLKAFECCFMGDWKWVSVHDLRPAQAAARFVELYERETRRHLVGCGLETARVAVRLAGDKSDGRVYVVTGQPFPHYQARQAEG